MPQMTVTYVHCCTSKRELTALSSLLHCCSIARAISMGLGCVMCIEQCCIERCVSRCFLGLELGLRLSGGRLVDRSTMYGVHTGGRICLLDDMVKGCPGEALATSSRCEISS